MEYGTFLVTHSPSQLKRGMSSEDFVLFKTNFFIAINIKKEACLLGAHDDDDDDNNNNTNYCEF